MTTTYTFAVAGMHCASCGILIDETLEEDVQGVHRSTTNVRKGQTVVEAGIGVTPHILIAAIAGAGYQATLEATP
jgi:copper chaperone CopZ